MANTRVLIFESELLIQISFPTLNDGLDINDKLLGKFCAIAINSWLFLRLSIL